MEVRFTTVTLVPPASSKGRYAPVTLSVVEARELAPPPGEKALPWIVVTTLPVTDFAEACQCVEGDAYRWLIEHSPRTEGSGCRIEALQLQTAARLEVALVLYCLVAWRVLGLT